MAAPSAGKIRVIFSNIFHRINSWQRYKYIRFRRQVMGEATDATLDDISILHRSENYLVVNKRYDVLINDNEPAPSPSSPSASGTTTASDDSGTLGEKQDGSSASGISDVVTSLLSTKCSTSYRPPWYGTVNVAAQLFHKVPELADPALEHHFRFVHRLDFATSGVLCLALNKKAAAKAAAKFQQRLTTKHYLALVRNTVTRVDEHSELTISKPIGRDKSEEIRNIMCTDDDPNCDSQKPCTTKMVLLETGTYDGDPASKILLIPITGRTHQLRVHCCHIGHQIVGDYAYSGRKDVSPYRMMLHAYRLVIPMQHEYLDIIAPDPFIPETDNKWKPEKIYRTYEGYVKDKDFNKLPPQKVPVKQQPKRRHRKRGGGREKESVAASQS